MAETARRWPHKRRQPSRVAPERGYTCGRTCKHGSGDLNGAAGVAVTGGFDKLVWRVALKSRYAGWANGVEVRPMPYERITQKQWETLRELIDPAEWSTISTFMSQREASDLIFLHGHRRAMERIERNTPRPVVKDRPRYTLEERLAYLAKVEAEFAAKQAEQARITANASSRPYPVHAPFLDCEKAATEPAAPPGRQSALMRGGTSDPHVQYHRPAFSLQEAAKCLHRNRSAARSTGHAETARSAVGILQQRFNRKDGPRRCSKRTLLPSSAALLRRSARSQTDETAEAVPGEVWSLAGRHVKSRCRLYDCQHVLSGSAMTVDRGLMFSTSDVAAMPACWLWRRRSGRSGQGLKLMAVML